MSITQNINLKEIHKYNLCFRLSEKDVIIVIEDKDNIGNVLFSEKYSFDQQKTVFENIKEIIYENTFLAHSFNKVNVICAISEYSIVPSRFFEKSTKNQIYNYVNKIEERIVTYYNEIDYREITIISSCDKFLHGFLNRNLNQPIFYSSVFFLLRYIYKIKESYYRNMYLIEDNGSLNIIAFENKDLKICRTLKSQDEHEKLYFVLKIWEALNWEQKEDKLHYYGNISNYLKNELSGFLAYINELQIETNSVIKDNEEYSILDFKLLTL